MTAEPAIAAHGYVLWGILMRLYDSPAEELHAERLDCTRGAGDHRNQLRKLTNRGLIEPVSGPDAARWPTHCLWFTYRLTADGEEWVRQNRSVPPPKDEDDFWHAERRP